MTRSTPRKLRNKDVLAVLRKHSWDVPDAAEELSVSIQAVYAWLRRNNCQRVFVVDDNSKRKARAAVTAGER